MKVKLLSHVLLFATPWTVGDQVPLSMAFSWRVLEWVAISSFDSVFTGVYFVSIRISLKKFFYWSIVAVQCSITFFCNQGELAICARLSPLCCVSFPLSSPQSIEYRVPWAMQ